MNETHEGNMRPRSKRAPPRQRRLDPNKKELLSEVTKSFARAVSALPGWLLYLTLLL